MRGDSSDIAALPPDLLAAATEALAGETAARDGACRALCAAHPAHEGALRRLFAELSAVERLLEGGYGAPSEPPARFGHYRVVRRLGEGAFGEVFLCEQEEPVRRQVAVKVLRAGAGDRTTLLRFAAERQLIASLQHPAIAQVFDAGTLADGRPFFVMDAIDGAPIDRWCDEHASSVEDRIELFCDLCRGVQHAHDRGIVHRDLKPANVLVVEIDGRPRPKIIDFGIAKVLQTSGVPRSFDTEAGRVVGTPGYMSPEQQKGSSDDVDARADVFCLGVILYELLCGQLPWAAGAAATDTDPERPSTRVSSRAATATAIARHRATEPRRLASHLRGDLDWIVLKCLQRERGDRYRSAQELIDDLERHRRAEPVRAGPPSTGYRLKKFARRHRGAVTALASAVVVAVVGLVVAGQYSRSASAAIGAASAEADSRLADATAAVALLVLRANDPAVREAPKGDAAREAMLRDALSFYDRFLLERPADPALRVERCRALVSLAHVLWSIGDAQRSTEFALLAKDEAEALYGAHRSSLERRGLFGRALCRLGAARALAGDAPAALASFEAAVEHLAAAAAVRPAEFGGLHASALRGAATELPSDQGELILQRLRAALQVLESLRSVDPPVPELAADYVLTCCVLGQELRVRGALADAETLLQRADEQVPRIETDRLHAVYRVATLRGQVARQAGKREDALVHLQAAQAAATSWQREQPNRLLPCIVRVRAHKQLASAQNLAGDFDASLDSYREAIAQAEAAGKRFPTALDLTEDTVQVLESFASTLFDQFRRGVLDEAALAIERAVALHAEAGQSLDQRWRLLGLQALIADSRIVGGGDPYWPGVEAALPDPQKTTLPDKDPLLAAYVGLCRWHLDRGRLEQARAALARADAWIAADPKLHAKRTVDVAWLTARLAAAAGDHAACAAAADRLLAARRTWYGWHRAGNCLFLAWRCAKDDRDAGVEAVRYRDRALDCYWRVEKALQGDVAKDPLDPWFVVPWGVSGVRIAELLAAAGDGTAAAGLLAAALPRLAGVRGDAHCDQWDEQAFRDGSALQDKLAAAGR